MRPCDSRRPPLEYLWPIFRCCSASLTSAMRTSALPLAWLQHQTCGRSRAFSDGPGKGTSGSMTPSRGHSPASSFRRKSGKRSSGLGPRGSLARRSTPAGCGRAERGVSAGLRGTRSARGCSARGCSARGHPCAPCIRSAATEWTAWGAQTPLTSQAETPRRGRLPRDSHLEQDSRDTVRDDD